MKDMIFLALFTLVLVIFVNIMTGCAAPISTVPRSAVNAEEARELDQENTSPVNGQKTARQHELSCPATGDCNVELTLPIRETVIIRVEDRNEGNNKVPTWVKYFALPAAGAAAGAGYFGMKYPNEFNEEDGTVFYSGTSRGALVGAASGVFLGLIVDLLDD